MVHVGPPKHPVPWVSSQAPTDFTKFPSHHPQNRCPIIFTNSGYNLRSQSFLCHTKPGWWCNNHLEKYETQWEGLSHILWKITNVWNHQPETVPFFFWLNLEKERERESEMYCIYVLFTSEYSHWLFPGSMIFKRIWVEHCPLPCLIVPTHVLPCLLVAGSYEVQSTHPCEWKGQLQVS